MCNCQKNLLLSITGKDNLGGIRFQWIRHFGTGPQREPVLDSHPYSWLNVVEKPPVSILPINHGTWKAMFSVYRLFQQGLVKEQGPE